MGRAKHGRGNASCEVCGNDQSECFEIHLGGERHVFDSFECAMRAFSPRCDFCDGPIMGQGVVSGNSTYCSFECANARNGRDYEARVHLREHTNF